VHCARSSTGVAVVSVIADPAVAPSAVHRAAHDVADYIQYRPTSARYRPLFELPLGDGHAWTITETQELLPDDDERYDAVLPAWEAENRHNLITAPDLGVEEAVAVLVAMISPEWPDRHGVAIQAARARYTARGFQAAALTALGTVGSSWDPPPTPIPVRHAQLRFDRPYAVLAFAVPDDGYYPTKDSLWDAVPVFSAWVAEPSEASD
jgi:hypothetical protein